MKADFAGSGSKQGDMWSVHSASNRYIVFGGHYTMSRWANGRDQQVSIMHPRYAGLRARIDAAIEAKKNLK